MNFVYYIKTLNKTPFFSFLLLFCVLFSFSWLCFTLGLGFEFQEESFLSRTTVIIQGCQKGIEIASFKLFKEVQDDLLAIDYLI